MANPSGLRINSPPVTHQTIDGEVVIVNLETGCYYSLDNTGAEIWSALEAGASPGEIVSLLQQRYQGSRHGIEGAVNKLVNELLQEAILVPGQNSADASAAARVSAPATAAAAQPNAFEPPVLHKFTDMRDLLLLDPIHEVDETGWPNVKPAA